jgi:signal transduction histidine kinase
VSVALALSGWLSACAAAGVAVALQRDLGRRAELVARASHEVRGPLNAARLAIHLVERRGPVAPQVHAVDLELRRAARALDDLDAARIGRRVRDRADVIDVGGVVREAAAAWRPVAEARGIRLRLDAPPGSAAVRGDRARLAQACENLVANAIEHGGGTVRVRARADEGRVRIEVQDEGPGLPAPVADLVGRATAGRGRRGRGLAIAADVAARHGGRLAAAPSARGARLAIDLPAARASRSQRA